MNWVQINIRVNEDFRYMKIHIFALRWKLTSFTRMFICTQFKPSLEILVSVTHRETVRYVVPLQKPVTDTSSSERSPWSPAPILPSKVS